MPLASCASRRAGPLCFSNNSFSDCRSAPTARCRVKVRAIAVTRMSVSSLVPCARWTASCRSGSRRALSQTMPMASARLGGPGDWPSHTHKAVMLHSRVEGGATFVGWRSPAPVQRTTTSVPAALTNSFLRDTFSSVLPPLREAAGAFPEEAATRRPDSSAPPSRPAFEIQRLVWRFSRPDVLLGRTFQYLVGLRRPSLRRRR